MKNLQFRHPVISAILQNFHIKKKGRPFQTCSFSFFGRFHPFCGSALAVDGFNVVLRFGCCGYFVVEVIQHVQSADNIVNVSDSFRFAFENAGYMHDGVIYTAKITEREEPPIALGEILQRNVDDSFYITAEKMPKWTYLKGAKRIPRRSPDGHAYVFSEGPVAFPDPWDRPGRTMLTSGSTLNRSTHVVTDPGTGRLRLLTPVEAERLQGFDDEWTNTGMPDRMRYFCMGNALVVPMITRMGRVLDTIIEREG